MQPWLANRVNHCHSGYGPNAIKHSNIYKISIFLASSESLNGSSSLQLTLIPELDNIEIDFCAIFVENIVFYGIVWYSLICCCVGLTLPFALFSNVETEVNSKKTNKTN